MNTKPSLNPVEASSGALTVLDYSDYRLFLREAIALRKAQNRAFSMRFVAGRIGVDPGFFSRVLKGGRNINPDHVLGLAAVFRLNARESIFFQDLVSWNQARTPREKEHWFRRLSGHKGSGISRVGREQYHLYDEWFFVVLRELINVVPFHDASEADCSRLAGYFDPPVRPSELARGIAELRQAGLLVKDPGGRLRLADPVITSGDTIPAEIVRRVLRQFFQLGTDALDRFERPERTGATVTVSVSPRGFDKISQRLDQCRKEILELARSDDNAPDRVYHLNMQFFPVSKPYPGARK
jgi:uncharacterized protein (TIGR02147 family)